MQLHLTCSRVELGLSLSEVAPKLELTLFCLLVLDLVIVSLDWFRYKEKIEELKTEINANVERHTPSELEEERWMLRPQQ